MGNGELHPQLKELEDQKMFSCPSKVVDAPDFPLADAAAERGPINEAKRA